MGDELFERAKERWPEYFDPAYTGPRPPLTSYHELFAEFDDDSELDLSERDLALADVGRAALRARKAGVPVSINHATGAWTIGEPLDPTSPTYDPGDAGVYRGVPPDRQVTLTERMRALKEDLPPGDDAAQITAAKAEGLAYHPPVCHACGRPHELVRRFNSGNPMIHYEARCYCDDDNADVVLYHRIDALADKQTGPLGVGIQAWMDAVVRPALFGGQGHEQSDEDMQAGLLPGPEVDAGQVLAVDATADERGAHEGPGTGTDAPPAPREVGPRVDGGVSDG